jgi:hypothetical protein
MRTKCKYNANVYQITINEILYFWYKMKTAISTTTSFQFEIFQISRHIHFVFCIWISNWWESMLNMRLVKMFRKLMLNRADFY